MFNKSFIFLIYEKFLDNQNILGNSKKINQPIKNLKISKNEKNFKIYF
jgi:hypothetical protein